MKKVKQSKNQQIQFRLDVNFPINIFRNRLKEDVLYNVSLPDSYLFYYYFY
jgi:hypothetical protein